MSQDPFIKRHIGTDERGVSEMLRTIGVRSTEELIEQVIPDAIRLKKPLNLPPQGMSEYQFAAHIRAIARIRPGIPRTRLIRPKFRRDGWKRC